jgi:EmrB/QacA subfamily drug resistance transporter
VAIAAAGVDADGGMVSADASSAPSNGAGDSNRRRWHALAVGLVAAFMNVVDISIVNVAIPSIDRSLNATPSDLQWVLAGYALAFALPLVPAGRLGDEKGRRGLFVVGIALFTLSSAMAGLAQSPLWLIAARLVQGAAAGVVLPQVSGLIQELFRPPERGRPFGLLGATVGLATALGPLLGGLLISLGGAENGWRLVFFVNVPVGVLAVVLGERLIPGSAVGRHSGPRRLDLIGVLLLGVGVLLILLPLVQRTQWLLIPVGVLVLAGFAIWERRYTRHPDREPLVDLRLYRFRSYSLGMAIAALYFAGFTAIFFIFTLYLQSGLGYSALIAGLATTPFALGSAVAAAIGGRIVNRIGRPLVATGLVAVVVGLSAIVLLLGAGPSRGQVPWLTAAPLLVAGLGGGLVVSPNLTLTLSQVPVEEAGSAGGVLQTSQRLGSAIGIAAVGSLFFSSLAASNGDWALAFRHGLVLCAGLIGLALIAAAIDVLAGHRRSAAARNRPGQGGRSMP